MSNDIKNENDKLLDFQKKTEPAVRPVYSVSDYANKRPLAPPVPIEDEASSARERVRKRRVSGRQNSSGEWLWVVVAAALFVMVLAVSLGAFFLVQESQAKLEVLPTSPAIVDSLPTSVFAYRDYSNTLIDDSLVLPDGSSIELAAWDGISRFTVVLVGLDRRSDESGLAYRTDTMLLVSIDPQSNSMGILSIPRDLFVEVPGYSQLQRVNSAMVLGEYQEAGYGPSLMLQTLRLNLGIAVSDYLAMDFQAVIDLVDAIGGIDVQTTYTINDPLYPDLNYGYDPFYLAAGSHHLNGYNALRFARTRHGDSDIQRAERQQEVIFAVRDRILGFDMIPTLIAQSPVLWASWRDNVYTGLSLEQLLQLGLYIKDIPSENIHTGVIDYTYLQSYTTDSGAQVLIPNRALLGQLMTEVFGANYTQ